MLESKWLPRSFGWLAVAFSFAAGLFWNGGVGYITLAMAIIIIWNTVNMSMSIGAIQVYKKMM